MCNQFKWHLAGFRNCTQKPFHKMVDCSPYSHLAISLPFKVEKYNFQKCGFKSMVVMNSSIFQNRAARHRAPLGGWPSHSCHKYSTDRKYGVPNWTAHVLCQSRGFYGGCFWKWGSLAYYHVSHSNHHWRRKAGLWEKSVGIFFLILSPMSLHILFEPHW